MTSKDLQSLFWQQVQHRPGSIAAMRLVQGDWRNLTWEELGQQVRELALGLLTLDVKKCDRVAIVASSRLDWVVADLAIMACGGVSAAVLHRFRYRQMAELLDRADCKVAFVGSYRDARELLQHRASIPSLRYLIVLEDGAGSEPVEDSPSLTMLSISQVRERGRQAAGARAALLSSRQESIEASDTMTLLYTVGTTERIKAVAISHDAMSYEVEALSRLDLVTTDDTLLVCMPLSHPFARVFVGLWLKTGHTIAFADSTAKLFDKIPYVQPTVMAAPPRVFELLYGTIVRSGQDSRGPKSRLFAWAMKLAKNRQRKEREGVTPTQPGWAIARRAVFDRLALRLRRLFGGRVRLFVVGGGALAERVSYFFNYAGITINLTYGLTESCGISCVNLYGEEKLGTVGPALPGTELRLADDGEILIRGRGLMTGYWNEPDTGLTFTEDGFLHTGDVGELDVDGYLTIKGRKEDISYTKHGQIISPSSYEVPLRTSAFIAHALVDAGANGALVALISLDPETILAWSQARRLPYKSFSSLARSPEVRRLIQGVIDDRNRKYERTGQIKRFAIVDRPFAIGDELTATMRLRRDKVHEKYRVTLDTLHGVDDLGDGP